MADRPARRPGDWLRVAAMVLHLAVVTPPLSVLALLTFFLPHATTSALIGTWNHSMVWAARVIWGLDHEVVGRENLPAGPCVLCAKHQSPWETVAFHTIFPRICFVAKRSLAMIPLFGWGMTLAMKPVLINRGNPRESWRKVLAGGQDRLAKGWSMVLFPEGTRVPVGETKRFFSGAAAVAIAAGVPLVPIAHNSGLLWPRNGFLRLRPGTVTLSIGEPIDTTGQEARDVTAQAEAWINAETARLGG